jgi:hypothetical protein
VLAAIKLETLWNDLARELPFSLFCSYPSASVTGPEHADALHRVCHLHSSVLPSAVGGPGTGDDAPCQTELVAELAAERDAPGRARRLVVAALRRWGLDEALVQDAALVLSELATNAVVHARSPFSVAVHLDDAKLRIAVQDACPLTASGGRDDPIHPTGGPSAGPGLIPRAGHDLIPRTGHGLGLTEEISTRWGIDGFSDGKVVWAELPYEPI